MGVYGSTPTGDSRRLIEIASAIVIGSTDEEDDATIRQILAFCREHDYDLQAGLGSSAG